MICWLKADFYLKLSRLEPSLHYLSEKIPRKKQIQTIYISETLRNSPKKVEIQNMETGEINIYSSLYKAAKRFNQQSRLITAYDGKVWRNRYAIKVLTKSECI